MKWGVGKGTSACVQSEVAASLKSRQRLAEHAVPSLAALQVWLLGLAARRKLASAKERNAGLQLEPRLATGAKTMLWLRAVAQEQAQDEAPLGQTSRAVHVLREKGLAQVTLARALLILRFLASHSQKRVKYCKRCSPPVLGLRSVACGSLAPACGGRLRKKNTVIFKWCYQSYQKVDPAVRTMKTALRGAAGGAVCAGLL